MNVMNVLFVDDETYTLRAIERLLRKEGFGKYFADSAARALQIMAEVPIHIIVADIRMPEVDGLTLLIKVKEKYPETVRLALSACTQTAQLLPCINT
jgi:YesN/AraC family two-component response regulator